MRELRAAFAEIVAQEDATRLRFLDETSGRIDFARRYGRAPDGQRCVDAVPHTRGRNVPVVATLSPQGLEAVMEVEGALNQDVFAAYLEHVLAPELRRGDVIVLDNLSAHKDKTGRLDALVAARGARLLYLPPCICRLVSAALLARFLPHRTRVQQTQTPPANRRRQNKTRLAASLGRSYQLDCRTGCQKLV